MAAPSQIDAETLMQRLHAAGRTLACMPARSARLGFKTQTWNVVAPIVEATAQNCSPHIRPPAPCARDITMMDEAFGWLLLIPSDVSRKIVAARCNVNAFTGRNLLSWREIARAIGADHKTVQNWYAKAIDDLVIALNARQARREAA